LVCRLCCELAGVLRPMRIDLELEIFPLANILDGGIPESVKSIGDGLSLGIENGRLESDKHARSHLTRPPGGPADAGSDNFRMLLKNTVKDAVHVLQLLIE